MEYYETTTAAAVQQPVKATETLSKGRGLEHFLSRLSVGAMASVTKQRKNSCSGQWWLNPWLRVAKNILDVRVHICNIN